jgi:uncharacterized protein (TIGR03000 family)
MVPRRFVRRALPLVALAALLSTAVPVGAGGHGGGGGGHGGGGHGGGGHGGGGHGGGGFHGGGFHGGGFHGGYGRGGWGGGWGWGWGGWGWGGWGWDGGWGGDWGWPGYYGWDYGYPARDFGYPGYYLAAPAPTDGLAHFKVTLPTADAQVWLNGKATEQTGKDRLFKSPPITPGQDYSYEVRARWLENGQPVERTQTVTVRANKRQEIDLTKPADTVAHFKVVVPANADVWLNGAPTKQTGSERLFKSPPIAAGQDYSYEVRARWLENGQPVERTETILVKIGKDVSVNLTKSAVVTNK